MPMIHSVVLIVSEVVGDLSVFERNFEFIICSKALSFYKAQWEWT